MSRSIWKPSYIHTSLLNQQKKSKNSSEVVVFNRATKITTQMVGWKIQIYNGVKFYTILINNDMVGHLLGEFAPTRKKHIPPKKKIQQK